MAEKLTSPGTNSNSSTPPSEWNFVKDTSLEKTTQSRVVLGKDGKPETVNYTYIDSRPDHWAPAGETPLSSRPFSIDQLSKLSGSTDQNELKALQLDPEKLRGLIAEKVGDKDDLEKIDYYLQNPAGAIHDLVNAPQELEKHAEKGDLVPEQALSANEDRYNELLDRLAVLEQNYPSLKNRGASSTPDIPRDVDREWILIKHYLEYLAKPVDDLSNHVSNKYNLTDSGRIIEKRHSSSLKIIESALEFFSEKNKDIIKEDVTIPEKVNPYKASAEWLSKINTIDSLDSLKSFEEDIKSALSPTNSQYTLRAKYILNEKINDSIKKKRTELELKSATKTRNELIEKYKSHPDDLINVKPLNIQTSYNRTKKGLKTITKDLETAKKDLLKLQKQLNNIPSYRKFGRNARSLKHQVESRQETVNNLSTQLSETQRQYDLAQDRLRFYRANAQIAKLTQP